MGDDRIGLLLSEDHRQVARTLGALNAFNLQWLQLQDLPIEKQQRMKGLILRRGRNFVGYGQMGKKSPHIVRHKLARMPFMVKKDVSLDPGDKLAQSAD